MPVFIAKYNEIRESKYQDFEDEQGGNEQDLMLGTIRVPKNLRLLSERLPKSNYGPTSYHRHKNSEEQKSIDKQRDLSLHEIQEDKAEYKKKSE
jgi:hypothetical protein